MSGKSPNLIYNLFIICKVSGIYCALAISSMCNILSPELTDNCDQYIQKYFYFAYYLEDARRLTEESDHDHM